MTTDTHKCPTCKQELIETIAAGDLRDGETFRKPTGEVWYRRMRDASARFMGAGDEDSHIYGMGDHGTALRCAREALARQRVLW